MAIEARNASGIRLSCIVVVYNMRREAKRTLHTLSTAYQKDISADEYEVIVVENGSPEPLDEADIAAFGRNVRLVSNPRRSQSPAGALNYGAGLARGEIIVSMVDGARMLSPRCLAGTLRAFEIFPNAAAIVPSWHLGPDLQNESIQYGYNQAVEDRLLDSVDWKRDGYELYRLCERLDLSSEGGAWFGPIHEANYIALDRGVYERLGGFDERFTSRGGGAVNLDFFRRVAETSGSRIVSLLGEATFHQYHGGVSTNVTAEQHPWKAIAAEYRAIRGEDWALPSYEPVLIGGFSRQCLDLLARAPSVFVREPPRSGGALRRAWRTFLTRRARAARHQDQRAVA